MSISFSRALIFLDGAFARRRGFPRSTAPADVLPWARTEWLAGWDSVNRQIGESDPLLDESAQDKPESQTTRR